MSEARNEHEKYIRENCCIENSELCHWLDKSGCLHCYIATIKADSDKQDALNRWKTTLSYLPEDFDNLHLDGKCHFCMDEPKDSDAYALFDMANPEPKSEKGMFFGFGKKVRTPIGSLLTVQAGICNKCKKTYRLIDILQIATPVIFLVVGIILLGIPAFSQPLVNLFEFLPLIFAVLMGVVGFYLGKFFSKAYLNKQKQFVKLDLALIPQVKRMLNKGWFFFQTVDNIPRLSFSKTKQYSSVMILKDEIEEMQNGENTENIISADTKQEEKDDKDDVTLDNFNI